jgi:hypothetical protein
MAPIRSQRRGLRRKCGTDAKHRDDGHRNSSTMHVLRSFQAPVSGECGGRIGGTSKPTKAELATAQAVFKATRLTFIVISPV